MLIMEQLVMPIYGIEEHKYFMQVLPILITVSLMGMMN